MEKKKSKKQAQSAALITGNPNDNLVIEPPEQQRVVQTEAVKKAISYLKSKTNKGEFEYIAPSEKKEVEQSAIEPQAKKFRDIAFRKVVVEAGTVAKIATSPIKATGMVAKGAIGTGRFINQIATPAGISAAAVATANAMANVATSSTSNVKTTDIKDISKERVAQMKIGTEKAKEDLKQKQLQTKLMTSSIKAKPAANTAPMKMKEWKIHSYLSNRAIESGIPEEIIFEVFNRGIVSWTDEAKQTAEQVAMQRVNSFIAKGKTYNEDDSDLAEERPGLWANIHAKRKRIEAGSGERMRKPGSKGAPTKQNFVDAAEETVKKTPHEKFKAGLKKAGYDPDAGAKRLLDLIAKQKKEREERESKARDAGISEEGDYPHVGVGSSKNMQMARDIARMKATSSMMKSIHGDSFQDKPMPDYEEDKLDLKPDDKGNYVATVRMRQKNPVVKEENIDESFVIDRAAGYSTTYTAGDLGIKIQGGFALHPSVTEEGGAGDEGTDKLVKKYMKDTPLESFSRMIRARRKANTQC
jgi:hypothetical protein